MLLLSGQVFNVFRTDRRTTKDGTEFGDDPKVQLMAQVPLENGTFRAELVDLKVKDPRPFEKRLTEDVQIPVGAFSPAKGQVIFFQTGEPIFDDARTSKESP